MPKFTYSIFFGFIIMLFSPVSVVAQDNNQSATATEADQGAKVKIGSKFYPRDETVCKRYAQIGTRIKSRTCMTAGQWLQYENDSKAMAEEMRPGINSARPN